VPRIVGQKNDRANKAIRLPCRVWGFAVGGGVTHLRVVIDNETYHVGVGTGPHTIPAPVEPGPAVLDGVNWYNVADRVTTPTGGTYVIEWDDAPEGAGRLG
jgi:arylamine N-acetyltransferase